MLYKSYTKTRRLLLDAPQLNLDVPLLNLDAPPLDLDAPQVFFNSIGFGPTRADEIERVFDRELLGRYPIPVQCTHDDGQDYLSIELQ